MKLFPSIEDYPTLDKPLAMMDVFAGCGGLSIGLELFGVGKAKWAIENNDARYASEAYKLNHPGCKVIRDDVNNVLKEALEENENSQIPKKGQVELICGGPPCQGFSVMNVFTANDASRFKNSLISSYLSYADYYRWVVWKICTQEDVVCEIPVPKWSKQGDTLQVHTLEKTVKFWKFKFLNW